MQNRLNAFIVAAVILLGGVAVLVVGGSVNRYVSSARQTGSLPTPLGSAGQSALAQCHQNVTIIHDVHWAAACMANAADDSPECTLPDARAFALNAARSAAENRCIDEANDVERKAGPGQ